MSRTAPNRVAPRRRAPDVPLRRASSAPSRRRIAPQPRRVHRRAALFASLGVLAVVAVALPFALSATATSATATSADPQLPPAAEVVLPPAVPATPPAVPTAQSGPGTPRGDSQHITLDSGGLERGYFLLPALGLGPQDKAALLVVLHQDVSSGREIHRDISASTGCAGRASRWPIRTASAAPGTPGPAVALPPSRRSMTSASSARCSRTSADTHRSISSEGPCSATPAAACWPTG